MANQAENWLIPVTIESIGVSNENFYSLVHIDDTDVLQSSNVLLLWQQLVFDMYSSHYVKSKQTF